jgi:penicillin-binding protein 2
MWFKFFSNRRRFNLDPDEVLLDSSNLPSFNKQQFEGQIEKPISRAALYAALISFFIIMLALLVRVGYLELGRGAAFAARSESNSLRHTPIFAERGIIYDRNKVELAWNTPERTYLDQPGLAHVLGFVGYPDQDQTADKTFEHKELVGREGAERAYNDLLAGEKGIKIEETNVAGEVVTDYLLEEPTSGQSLTLSVDSAVQGKLFELIKSLAIDKDFRAGAGVIMDVETGELLAMTSYPEYNPNLVSVGKDKAAIAKYLSDSQSPFLNRTISGLYAPGSIFKIIMATAALSEKTISPEKTIISTGKLTIPNPYDPKHPTIFKDWKAHGAVDMRRALAVSSNVYFYVVGGGFGSQPGLGISRIDKYAKLFGLGAPTGFIFGQEAAGTIPTPEWKKENFNGEIGAWAILTTRLLVNTAS